MHGKPLQCQIVWNILAGNRFIVVKGKPYGRTTRHPTLCETPRPGGL